MSCFRRCLILAAACMVLTLVLPAALQAQARGAWVEIKGMPSQIQPSAGTFSIESLKVKSTSATKFEDRHDRRVNKKEFFSKFKANDKVEVEGYLKGNVITAHEIERKHR